MRSESESSIAVRQAEKFMDEGMRLFYAKDFGGAKKAFENALEWARETNEPLLLAQVLNTVGNAYTQSKWVNLAIQYFQEAMAELNPNDWEHQAMVSGITYWTCSCSPSTRRQRSSRKAL